MSNFHPLEIVGRGSETQLQVGENLNKLISALRVKPPSRHKTLIQCRFNGGPPSTTLDQRQTDIDSTSCVCWVRSTSRVFWTVDRV